jgi:hypothetical protein
MVNYEQQLNEKLKVLGGIIPKGEYSDQLKFWADSIVLNLSKVLNGGKLRPKAIIRFINNPQVNAIATKIDDVYIIGIFLGYIYVVNDLFFRMLSSPNVLRKFGDTTHETTRRIHNAEISDSDILHLATYGDTRHYPINEARRLLAIILSTFCLNNLVLHEYAHINFGHVDYLLNKQNQGAYYEMSANNNNFPFSMFQQNCELQADAFAVNMSMNTLLSKKFSAVKVNEKISKYLEDIEDRIFLWNFAAYAYKRIFGYRKYYYSELDQLSHPPPSFRQHLSMGLIRVIIKKNHSSIGSNNLEKILKESVLEVEHAFSDISEQSINMDAYKFVFHDEIEKYHLRLKAAYPKVISELKPYAFENPR